MLTTIRRGLHLVFRCTPSSVLSTQSVTVYLLRLPVRSPRFMNCSVSLHEGPCMELNVFLAEILIMVTPPVLLNILSSSAWHLALGNERPCEYRRPLKSNARPTSSERARFGNHVYLIHRMHSVYTPYAQQSKMSDITQFRTCDFYPYQQIFVVPGPVLSYPIAIGAEGPVQDHVLMVSLNIVCFFDFRYI